jgi:hypothetical protein
MTDPLAEYKRQLREIEKMNAARSITREEAEILSSFLL